MEFCLTLRGCKETRRQTLYRNAKRSSVGWLTRQDKMSQGQGCGGVYYVNWKVFLQNRTFFKVSRKWLINFCLNVYSRKYLLRSAFYFFNLSWMLELNCVSSLSSWSFGDVDCPSSQLSCLAPSLLGDGVVEQQISKLLKKS